jgi:WS/DGAT/MGAT family acyltransferase
VDDPAGTHRIRPSGTIRTVPERLSAVDVSFLYLEGRSTPMHVGEIAIFRPPPEGFDYEGLVQLVEERISLVPRYRQKISWVPGHLANPLWVDDPDFDVTYHVRRSGLPRPGTDSQLFEFCARVQSRPLDRHRPLWEMYLIEGLADGRVAIATKTHHSMVDGIDSVDIEQVILDVAPSPVQLPDELWMPEPVPSSAELVVGAVGDIIRRPAMVADTMRLGVGDILGAARRVTSTVGSIASAVRSVVHPAPSTPLNATVGEARRFAVARTSLADYQAVHRAQGVPVNDVILATLAGALHGWLLFRGESAQPGTSIRTMLPVGVRPDEATGVDAGLSALFVDLPVGEPNPILRLKQVGFATSAHRDSGQSVSADYIANMAGFAPPTMHAMGIRMASGLARRMYNLVVTNVPGPQIPLYAAGATLLEMFPVVPLFQGQALAVGLTSYNGGVYFGLNGDRDAMPDVDVLAAMIEESLAELVAASAATARQSAGASGRKRRSAMRAVPRPATP